MGLIPGSCSHTGEMGLQRLLQCRWCLRSWVGSAGEKSWKAHIYTGIIGFFDYHGTMTKWSQNLAKSPNPMSIVPNPVKLYLFIQPRVVIL